MTLYENIVNRVKTNKESDDKILSAYDKVVKEQFGLNEENQPNKMNCFKKARQIKTMLDELMGELSVILEDYPDLFKEFVSISKDVEKTWKPFTSLTTKLIKLK